MKKLIPVVSALLTGMMFFSSCSYINNFLNLNNENASQSQIDTNIRRLDMNMLAENIDQIAEYDFSNNKVFGSAYYVFQDGVELKKCYGTMSLDSDVAISDTTIFRLASMSKPIAAVAALVLVERGFLSLDDTVDKYIPAFKNIKIVNASGTSTPRNMPTIKNILNHTSGIGGEQSKMEAMTTSDKQTLDSTIAFFIKCGLDFEPGTRQQYSAYGSFDVLVKIIEIVSGTDYLSFLNDYVLGPCGMVDTTFTPNEEQKSRMVDVHNRVNGENAVVSMSKDYIFDNFPSTHYLGGAGLVSTLSDYSKFANMLLNKGKVGKIRVLKEETLNLLCTPQVDYEIMPQNARWGLGVRVITEDTYPYLSVGSFGWSGAYGSHFWVDPENKIFAVFMKNSLIDGGAANESALNFEAAVFSALTD